MPAFPNDSIGCRRACGVLVLLLTYGAMAGESRPSSNSDVRKGAERAETLRKQTGLVRNVCQSSALVMKVGEMRCGHATVRIEDAKGEGGATYKLTESFKAAMAELGQSAVIDYGGTFLLGADLGLLTGHTRTRSDLTGKDGKRQTLDTLLDLTVANDTLAWQRSEQKDGAKEPVVKEKKTLALHGVRPVPQNALPGVAAFVMAAEQAGWKPEPRNGLCLPVLSMNAELDGFEIEPFWVSFDMPAYTNPKGTAAQMRARSLAGEITDKGLEVEPPSPPVWQAVQLWALDAQCCPLSHPAPDDKRIAVEAADPAALDANAPLDLAKIAAALER